MVWCGVVLCLGALLPARLAQPGSRGRVSCVDESSCPQPLSLELSLENGVTERVTLHSEQDVLDKAAELVARHSLSYEAHERLEIDLLTRWFDTVSCDEASEREIEEERKPLSFNVEIAGVEESINLSCEEDAFYSAESLSQKHRLPPDERKQLEESLLERWYEADDPPEYNGPVCPELHNVISCIELPQSGLVLEVADSVVAAGGRGLFIRCMEEVASVTLPEGTAVCGYADGEMVTTVDESGGKTVLFRLANLSTSVFFEQQLWTVEQLLELPDVDAIAGHIVERGEDRSSIISISPDAAYTGERYFVPFVAQPEPLSILQLGQFANDLAIGGIEEVRNEINVAASGAVTEGIEPLSDRLCKDRSGADYDSFSSAANMLVLVFRLERDPDTPSRLVPTRPVATLSQAATFLNEQPMELGCRYGEAYWQSLAETS